MIKLLKNMNSEKTVVKVRQVQMMGSIPRNKGCRAHLVKNPRGKMTRLEHWGHSDMFKICT